MKQLEKNTVGYRIRSTRLDKGINQKQFAEMLDIAPNYLGTVERGIREGSEALLRRAATVLGVSYSWLIGATIDPESAEQYEIKSNRDANNWKNVDIGAFFYLISKSSSIKKEDIAFELGISVDDVERIIDGALYDFDPAWESKLSYLALRGNILKVSNDMDLLNSQLLKERYRLEMKVVRYAIQDYLERCNIQNYSVDNPNVLHGRCTPGLTYNEAIAYKQQHSESPEEEQWIVFNYLAASSALIDENWYNQIFEIYPTLQDVADERKLSLFVACTSHESYDSLLSFYQERICGNKKYDTDATIKLLLVDMHSRQIERSEVLNSASDDERSVNKKSTLPEFDVPFYEGEPDPAEYEKAEINGKVYCLSNSLISVINERISDLSDLDTLEAYLAIMRKKAEDSKEE